MIEVAPGTSSRPPMAQPPVRSGLTSLVAGEQNEPTRYGHASPCQRRITSAQTAEARVPGASVSRLPQTRAQVAGPTASEAPLREADHSAALPRGSPRLCRPTPTDFRDGPSWLCALSPVWSTRAERASSTSSRRGRQGLRARSMASGAAAMGPADTSTRSRSPVGSSARALLAKGRIARRNRSKPG